MSLHTLRITLCTIFFVAFWLYAKMTNNDFAMNLAVILAVTSLTITFLWPEKVQFGGKNLYKLRSQPQNWFFRQLCRIKAFQEWADNFYLSPPSNDPDLCKSNPKPHYDEDFALNAVILFTQRAKGDMLAFRRTLSVPLGGIEEKPYGQYWLGTSASKLAKVFKDQIEKMRCEMGLQELADEGYMHAHVIYTFQQHSSKLFFWLFPTYLYIPTAKFAFATAKLRSSTTPNPGGSPPRTPPDPFCVRHHLRW